MNVSAQIGGIGRSGLSPRATLLFSQANRARHHPPPRPDLIARRIVDLPVPACSAASRRLKVVIASCPGGARRATLRATRLQIA
jgi:hypothetical protein